MDVTSTEQDDKVFAIYQALWKRAEDDGVWVHYDGMPTPASGGYHPRDHAPAAGPMITISRPYYEKQDEPTRTRNAGAPSTMPPPDILEETITLAHEYGHHRSHLAGNRTKEYVEAVVQIERYYAGDDVPPLTSEQQRLVREEEERAWSIGRSVLAELGFDLFAAFDSRESNGLAQYDEIFRWEVLPWHISAVEHWVSTDGARDPAAKLFLQARRGYYDAIENRVPEETTRRRSFEDAIWPSERALIETFRAYRANGASIESLRTAVEAYAAALDTERLRILASS